MSTHQTSYRSIFKATSIFGGVQVFNILITLIRGKALALLIGTAGMGLNGLLMSTLNLISSITSLGITESAIRDISKSHNEGDTQKMRLTYTVFNRWIWITAILGIVVIITFSSLLSKLSFNSGKHTYTFVYLSSTFIFGALTGGIYTLLRGTRQLKYLAQANIIGGIVGLIVSLPIFFFYGIKGVVPAIIITAIANFLVSLYFKRKVYIQPIDLNWKDTLQLGKPMVKLGISLTFINLLTALGTYILSAFISKTGTLHDLGLYSSAGTIVESYVGMVFAAMATDYFPRLSGVINDDEKWKKLVNEQAELVLIILCVVLVLLISTAPILIRILLSKEFIGAQDYIIWAVLAIPLKGVLWVIGFVILAKGDNKLFLTVEIISNVLVLVLNLFFYKYYGLTGLGVSLVISYFLASIMMLTIIKSKYNFQFIKEVFILFLKVIFLLIICVFSIFWVGYPNAYYLLTALVIFSIWFSVFELNKRMNLKEVLIKIKQKFIKK